MKKKSPLTPFFAQSIRKITETGILDAQRKRHTISEPNCKPAREKGRPLGFEIFASLFTFYAIACIISLMLLVMENIFHPKSKFWLEKDLSAIRKTDEELFDMPAQYKGIYNRLPLIMSYLLDIELAL